MELLEMMHVLRTSMWSYTGPVFPGAKFHPLGVTE